MEYTLLNTGAKMPMVGFGVFQIPDAEECRRVVIDAIKAGYRSFDTAASYMNEEAVGAAIREAVNSGLVTREELFITSKMWVQDMKNYDTAKQAIETSLSKLGLEYLDLYLLHQSMGNYFEAYRAMEDAYKEGKLKAIGVSNFFPHTLVNFCETVEIIPAVNQVELHPFFAQPQALEVMKEYGVQPEAWAPLAEGKHGIFTHPLLTEIGERYGKTAAQVVLRWNVQRGVVILPKSTKPERMAQNMDILDFTMTDEEMEQISALSLDHSEIINHFDPKLVQFLNRRKIHD
ncbi:MAG: aldo/keto reductase [Erysipelotrichaceae bacterium]|nr:aldo/keto reductase [Erysipelotrichaceae bacterium]